MRAQTRRWVALAAAVQLASCASAQRSPPASADASETPTAPGGTLIRPDENELGNRTLLQLIQRRMPNLQVRRSTTCPEIELRGRMSISRPNPPAIYVQGQRSANTCILDMMNVTDVNRIEVYPMGQGFRAGYRGSAGGLILVFLKDGSV